jgi:uncharacterized RDD family membrane protein YckC
VVSREPRFSQVVPNAVVASTRPTDLQAGLISTESTARDLARHSDAGTSASTTPSRPEPERPRLEVVPPGAQPSLFSPADYGVRPPSLRLERADATNGYIVPSKRKPARKRRKSDMLPFEQGTLEFLTPTTVPVRQLATTVEAAVTCDHPVASPMHRMLAASWDGVVIFLFAVALSALFIGISRALGVGLSLTPAVVAMMLAGTAFGVGVAYHAMFALFGWDTPGCRALGLRLVRLDGQPPTGLQRWLRLLGGVVSLAAGGAGFLWILFEEERLGWHDQASGTFPTPRLHVEGSYHKR